MVRIFIVLSSISLLLLAAALVIGLSGGDYNEVARRLAEASPAERAELLQEARPILARQTWHFLCGIGAVLLSVLVNSLCVTYFIGTGRWCREVAESYSLDEEIIGRSAALKRRCFPWSLLGIVTALIIAALGAASDPSTGIQQTSTWVTWHFLAALLGTGVIGVAFAAQVSSLRANQQLIADILDEVRKVRQGRGLEVE